MNICLEVSIGWEKGMCKSARMVMVFEHRILHVFLAEQPLSSATLKKQPIPIACFRVIESCIALCFRND